MLQWNTLLRSLGFTDSESKIYLISLEMGPSSVQDIAKKADVSRVTTYAVIESLAKHGLMSTLEK
ncbi:MAG TPA: helix-turn-helix domain-containing protein, partial [Nitrospirota bacterium]